ncbi:tryptophan-rich sensory protein [Lunatibacter salilacus]|uniref:tryptophan-rich sensory protein n=1 Tax=Lunatibacter salilacus TaxID=2483804 RepID=UPI00131B8A68|nr:tryptophan-rich sensory protein [Lunatibacter salilacus]
MKWWHCLIIFVVANIISVVPAGFNGDEAFYNNFLQPDGAPPEWLFPPMWLFLNITSLIGLYTISNLPVITKNRRKIKP